MKKYLSLLLIFITITTSAAIGGPSPSCFEAINPRLQEMFPMVPPVTFQAILSGKYEKEWAHFKQDAKAKGTWDTIVNACCPQCSVQDPKKCFGCSCNVGDECMWTCRCCWMGEALHCGTKIKP